MMSKSTGIHNQTILGIDPGLATVGWAVIKAKIKPPQLVECGSITTPQEKRLPKRCLEIYQDTLELITNFRPTAIVVEELFFSKNVKTAIDVAQARGAIMAAAAQADKPILEINPRTMKKRLTGNGQATKKQVMYMVEKIFQNGDLPNLDDTVDAIALAYAGSFAEL